MNKYLINGNNYDKFIFKGSLALESYYDNTHENKSLFDSFNDKLKKYRSLCEKKIVTKSLLLMLYYQFLNKLEKKNLQYMKMGMLNIII